MKLVTAGDADNLLSRVESAEQLAIDTEFMREKTYFAQLCLLQIGTPDDIFCLDPLGDGDQTPIWTATMARPWIVHSGRQDIEVVYQATEQMPVALFDTQVAAGLLGFPPQMGYASLVSELFGKTLNKSQTRADWSRRPLSREMLTYAAEDVEYLLAARQILEDKLEALGRRSWAHEDSMALLSPALYDVDVMQAVDRVKSARNMQGRKRRAAVALAAWRERRALASNRPRRWIMQDSLLVGIAQSRPANRQELADLPEMPASIARRSGDELIELLRRAETETDDYVPPPIPDESAKALLKRLQKETSRIADELELAAEVIAPRKELSAAILGARDSRVFSGWRREIVGERLLEILD